MQILLGVADFGEREEKLLMQAAKNAGLEINACERRYTKAGIMQYLDDHPDTDAVVLSEAVEGKAPFTAEDYELLAERHEHVRLIPILMDERCGTDYIKDVFHSGIYNAIFTKDAELSMVLRLMEESRSRKDAKRYYCIDRAENTSNDANIGRCVSRLEQITEYAEFQESVQHVYQILTPDEFREVVSNLSLEKQDMVRRIPEIGEMVPEEKPVESQTKGRFLSSVTNVFAESQTIDGQNKEETEVKKEDIHQPDPASQNFRMNALSVDDLFDIISNIIIGFVGNQRRAGVTHQAIMAAHFLASHGYQVALADCAAHGGKSMSAFEAIEKYRDTTSGQDRFTYLGVDYYKNISTETLNRIFSAPEKYHFVVIDYGVFSPYVKADIGRCSIKCAVCGSMPWEVNQLRAFADDTKFLRGQLVYLIRGVAEDARDKQVWLQDIVDNYRFADVHSDPFDGMCYPAMEELFEKYVKGLPVQGENKDTVSRLNSLGDVAVPVITEFPEEKKLKQSAGIRGFFKKKEDVSFTKSKPEKSDDEHFRVQKFKKSSGVYFVSSLRHGTGCTYLSVIIANMLAEHAQNVCLVTDDENLYEYLGNGVSVAYWDDGIDSVFAEYPFIVMDGGIIDGMSPDKQRERLRAAKKIMVCRSSEEYMQSLADFAAGEDDDGSGWVYAFNQIPPADCKKVQKVMELYQIAFIPSGNAKKLSKEMRKSIRLLI